MDSGDRTKEAGGEGQRPGHLSPTVVFRAIEILISSMRSKEVLLPLVVLQNLMFFILCAVNVGPEQTVFFFSWNL